MTDEEFERLSLSLPQTDCPVTHIFGPNLYIREMFIPANTWIVGHKHKHATLNIMVKGRIKVLLGDGTMQELVAPLTFTSAPGRKIAVTSEDTIWQNVWSTEEKDINKLEDMFLDKTEFALTRLPQVERFKQLQLPYEVDTDFNCLLTELDMTKEQVDAIAQDMSDHIDLPYGSYKWKVDKSPIADEGVFATSNIRAEELIGPVNISGKRTVLGRKVNHAVPPNAMMVKLPDGSINLYATQDIRGAYGCDIGEEITVDYRFTLLTMNPGLTLQQIKGTLLCQQE
jgi:hypothetical protein